MDQFIQGSKTLKENVSHILEAQPARGGGAWVDQQMVDKIENASGRLYPQQMQSYFVIVLEMLCITLRTLGRFA